MLVVLEVVVGSQVGRQIKIPQDQTCKVGRTNWADETFSDDVMMSGQHFEVQNDGKYCWLRDLDSRNGTRVDDDFVKENLVLRDGQTIFAGRTQFVVKIDGGAKNPYESTNYNNFEPVTNPALMSMNFGSSAFPANDPRFPSPSDGQSVPNPPIGPPQPPAVPTPPGQPVGGNIENLPGGFPPEGHFPPGTPQPGDTPPPGLPPTNFPPGAPRPGQPQPPGLGQPGPGQRGGDAPVFRFAKGGNSPPPLGPIPGAPGAFPTPPGSPGFPASPNIESPGGPGQPQPPAVGPVPNFPPVGKAPSPPGTPPAPPAAPNFGSSDDTPNMGNVLPPGTPPPEAFPGQDLAPPGASSPPPWLAGGNMGGGNPNLDFGSEDLDIDSGPGIDFGDDTDDEPQFGPPSFAGPSGPSFTNQQGPAGINPSLIGFGDDPPGNNIAGPSADEPTSPGQDHPSPFPPQRPQPNPNWRNPDYVSGESPISFADQQPEAAPKTPSADSVRGFCFQEETADSGYPVYHSVLEGVPQVPFSPFSLVSQLATLGKPVLAIHFMRAEKPIPEDLGGIPLRADLDAKFAALGGPMLYCPTDLEPFRAIINELWGLDAISCLFTSGDPHAIVDHFREGLFAPKRGDLPEPTPGPQFFAVFSPNLLATYLSARDQETVDELLGPTIEGVLTEVGDMPDSWQLFTKKSWAEPLKGLGMNRVVAQPQ